MKVVNLTASNSARTKYDNDILFSYNILINKNLLYFIHKLHHLISNEAVNRYHLMLIITMQAVTSL